MGEKIIIRPPEGARVDPDALERIAETVDEFNRAGPGAALVLPAGWTHEIVRADLPVIVETKGDSS